MAATKALSSGDWAASYNFLAALPVWGLMPRKEEVRSRGACPHLTSTSIAVGTQHLLARRHPCCPVKALQQRHKLPLRAGTGPLPVDVTFCCCCCLHPSLR